MSGRRVLAFFFGRMNLLWPLPFFKTDFLKIVSRIYTPILSSIGRTVSKKNDFFVENWQFWKMYIGSITSTLEVTSVQRTVPIDSAHSLLQNGVIFMVPSFLFLEKWPIFHEKVAKSCFKNCPFSLKLRDICYSHLLSRLVKFSKVDSLRMFISHQNVSTLHCFPYYEGMALAVFFEKKMNNFWPPFSKFIFPKSSRASTHQFWARSDQSFSRKMTFLLKIDHFENVNRVNYLDIGGCQRPTDGTNRFGALFTAKRCYVYGSIFFISWSMIHFFHEKVTKNGF